jgi:geranylgeranyl transferase type-2 subunit alpha
LLSAPSFFPWTNETVHDISKLFIFNALAVHCWGYRRFLGDFFTIDPGKEFEYTSKKVYENFSNYSAWHRRAQLIPLLPESERREVIDSGSNRLFRQLINF